MTVRELFTDKSKEKGICAFFTMLLAMCMVGSYYLQFSRDIYWVKLVTYVVLLICSVYVLVFSVKNKEKNAKSVAIGLTVLFGLSVVESIFGVLSRVDFRNAAEAAVIAVKAAFVFLLIDTTVLHKNMMKTPWYIALSAVLLLVPAILRILPICFSAMTNSALGQNVQLVIKIEHAIVALFGLAGVVFAIVSLARKQNTFVCWSSLLYGLSVLMYGVFGYLSLYFNTNQWTLNTAMLFELSSILLILGAVNEYAPAPKKVKKK